jgi:hypothetical protein
MTVRITERETVNNEIISIHEMDLNKGRASEKTLHQLVSSLLSTGLSKVEIELR